MLVSTNSKKIKLILITLALLLIPLNESIAAKGRGRKGRSSKTANSRSSNRSGWNKWRTNNSFKGNHTNFRNNRSTELYASTKRPSIGTVRFPTLGATSFNASSHARGNFNAFRHSKGSFDDKKHALRDSGTSRFGTKSLRRHKRPKDRYRYHHNFRPNYHRRHRVIFPPRRPHRIYYHRSPHFTFRYFHPRHHRKYIFVSLGGCWPIGYNYTRYYWYGCHPYRWYGYNPVIYQVEGDTYNYYTYDGIDSGAVTTLLPSEGIRPVDENTFADVRQRLAEQAAKEPDQPTVIDRYFENAVDAFDAGDYKTAANKLAVAVELKRDDLVLPFAYVQALFADQQYNKAAQILRDALGRMGSDQRDIFYPRGLYPEENVLFEQIGRLAAKAERENTDTDLQLLLGYHYLGTGKLDRAQEQLLKISTGGKNAEAAAILQEIMQKAKTENTAKTKNS